MITVVCLSPSLDKTLILSSLVVGGTNRVLESRTVPGGKGVNVAMALRRMGCRVKLIVYRHERGAQALFDMLHGAGVEVEAISVPGELRVNLKLMDQASGVVTEVNSAAQSVSWEAQQAMEQAVAAAAKESEWLILTGSMPRGSGKDTYARMIASAKAQAPGCRIALDAEGEAFAFGVKEKPDFVKPNLHELELYMGKRLDTQKEMRAAISSLVEGGVGTALVSMGKEGCVFAGAQELLYADALDIPVVTTVGAGDAMLAGYIAAWKQGSQEALRYAVAAASARVAGREGNEERFLPLVNVQRIAKQA